MPEILWMWADKEEGVVETRSWGGCMSETCNHFSHDPYFEYRVTLLPNAEVLWRGEEGERIVRSLDTGRVFYTRYRSNGHYRPSMITIELEDGVLPKDLWEALVERYESPRHRVLMELVRVVEVEGMTNTANPRE